MKKFTTITTISYKSLSRKVGSFWDTSISSSSTLHTVFNNHKNEISIHCHHYHLLGDITRPDLSSLTSPAPAPAATAAPAVPPVPPAREAAWASSRGWGAAWPGQDLNFQVADRRTARPCCARKIQPLVITFT